MLSTDQVSTFAAAAASTAAATTTTAVKKCLTTLSKRGTAAFASAHRAGFADDVPTRPSPGPGHFEPYKDTFAAPVTSSASGSGSGGGVDGGSTHLSPVFHLPVPKPRLDDPARVPSLVADVERMRAAKHATERHKDMIAPTLRPRDYEAPCAAFTTHAPRMQDDAAKAALPSPWAYQPPSIVDTTAAAATAQMGAGPSAAFASQVMRFGSASGEACGPNATGIDAATIVATIPAPLPRVPARALPAPVTDALTQIRRACATPDVAFAPPPVAPSAAFAATGQDRFGQPTVRYAVRSDPGQVGPGSYDASEPKRHDSALPSPWTRSQVTRIDPRLNGGSHRAPGPAYYTPKALPAHQSHHERDGIWMA
jgi:hypothetical protein